MPDITITPLTPPADVATGGLPYTSGTTWAVLPDVAAGSVLVSGGLGAAPAYSAAPVLTTATLSAGGGSGTYAPGGALTVGVTQAGTGANTSETDLWTYALPANTLNANGKAIRITVWGVTGANANNKTIKLYFGATTYTRGPSALNGSVWKFVVEIVRTGTGTQTSVGWGTADSSLSTYGPQPTADETSAITIKLTGQNGSASANDIVFRGAIVEVLN